MTHGPIEGRASRHTVIRVSAEDDLADFVSKFAPEMQDRIRGCRAWLQTRFPDAIQLVYDNYNFLVIGFGPTQRPSDSVLSLACDRNRVTLCFLQRGPELPDPAGLLRGEGSVVRSLRLTEPVDLDRPEIGDLIDAALGLARIPMGDSPGYALVIKSVSAKQRPRR